MKMLWIFPQCNIVQAAHRAIDAGYTTYTAHAGIPALREAICRKLKTDNGLEYRPEQICVTTGAKLAIYAALFALCDPGDEVIVPSPCWVSYTEQIHMVGAVPVIVEMSAADGFNLDAQKLRRQITPRTRVIILNSTNNPTGVVYSREALEAVETVAREHGLYVISDEIYEKLVYEKRRPFVSYDSVSKYAYEHSIVINGVSKAYAMTGWRVGYAAGSADCMKALTGLIGHMTSSANTIAQYAALEALTGPQESVSAMCAQFHERRDYLLERLSRLPGVQCSQAQGAFYLFPDVHALFGRSIGGRTIKSSLGLSEVILEKALVGTIPGIAFSAPAHIRLSYANSMSNIEKAMDRIEQLLRTAE